MRRISFLLSLLVAIFTTPALASPKVVASFKPVHSLVAAVMQGAGEPALLVGGAASPHTYALKPSDAQKLSEADLVFWIGPEMEAFLEKPVAKLGANATSVELIDADGIVVLPPRGAPGFEDDGDHDAVDPHVWLSPDNAIAMVKAIAMALDKADPQNAKTYDSNAAATEAKIAGLKAKIGAKLAHLPKTGFISFHDAYQYFEKSFGVTAVGAIAVHPENPPGAAGIAQKRDLITSAKAKCVFSEPSFDSKLVNTIVEGTAAKTGILDPEGALQEPGPDAYINVMEALATSLAECLSS